MAIQTVRRQYNESGVCSSQVTCAKAVASLVYSFLIHPMEAISGP